MVAGRSAPAGPNFNGGYGESSVEDTELVMRAAAVLDAYLRRTTGRAGAADGHLPAIHDKAGRSGGANGHAKKSDLATMSEEEALAILDLEPGPTTGEIREAHHRIAQNIHPDGGGSHYLAVKVNQAKELLLQAAGDRSPRGSSKTSRKRGSSRRPQQRPNA
jgi:hypothetical protein